MQSLLKPSSITILSCSPRVGGNCDTASSLIKASAEKQYVTVHQYFLRDYRIKPCISCGACRKRKGYCSLDDENDDTQELLFKLTKEGDVLVIVSPIYFLGPPAQLKALIDRTQKLWFPEFTLKDFGKDVKPALILLCGARKEKRVFEPTLHILKTWLPYLIHKAEEFPHQLCGLEAPHDILTHSVHIKTAQQLGSRAAVLAKSLTYYDVATKKFQSNTKDSTYFLH